MNIVIKISANDLPASHQKTIKDALAISSKQSFDAALEKLAKTAFLEYCKMIVENGTPSNVDDMRMNRLFLLIQHYYVNRLPNEIEVENIFHLGNKSRSLLQNTLSQYKTSLSIVNSSLLEYLNKAEKSNDNLHYQFESTPGIISELNSIIKEKWASLEIISRVYKTANLYKCPVDTYNELKKYLQ